MSGRIKIFIEEIVSSPVKTQPDFNERASNVVISRLKKRFVYNLIFCFLFSIGWKLKDD